MLVVDLVARVRRIVEDLAYHQGTGPIVIRLSRLTENRQPVTDGFVAAVQGRLGAEYAEAARMLCDFLAEQPELLARISQAVAGQSFLQIYASQRVPEVTNGFEEWHRRREEPGRGEREGAGAQAQEAPAWARDMIEALGSLRRMVEERFPRGGQAEQREERHHAIRDRLWNALPDDLRNRAQRELPERRFQDLRFTVGGGIAGRVLRRELPEAQGVQELQHVLEEALRQAQGGQQQGQQQRQPLLPDQP